MSLFNCKLKNVTLKELLAIIILLIFIYFFLNSLNIVSIDSFWIYIFIIVYFIFKFRNCVSEVKKDIFSSFSISNLKLIVPIVLLNIFISYGFLYLSDYILNIYNMSLSNSIVIASFLATVVVSPISEELIFRGVFLNRLQLIVPPLFAVLISSLMFAALHPFGNITSAFIFGICMAILYLKTDNIFVPIFAHFLNNLLAEGIRILDSANMLFANEFVVMFMSVLAIVSLFLILHLIFNELNKIK